MNPETEPVRLGGWVALAVGIALNALLGWALDLDVKAIVATTTTMALTSIGGLEWARQNVWSPVSHFREMYDVGAMTPPDDEDGSIDLHTIAWVLVVLILAVVLVRLL